MLFADLLLPQKRLLGLLLSRLVSLGLGNITYIGPKEGDNLAYI